MTRWWSFLFSAFLLIAGVLGTSRLALAKCPLDIQSCLRAFGHMRERPWLGVEVDTDSLGHHTVVKVIDGSPAQKAGIRPGDVLEKMNGKPIDEWWAGRSGWTFGTMASCTVQRGEHDQDLSLHMEPIPEDMLDRMIGAHMLQEHLADAGNVKPDVH